MPDVKGVLSCQLAVSGSLVVVNVAIVLHAGVLEAVEGPLSLQLLLGPSKLPEEGQVMRKVAYELGVGLEAGGLLRKFRRV